LIALVTLAAAMAVAAGAGGGALRTEADVRVAALVFSPNFIGSGTLAPNQLIPITLTALDATNAPVPGATVLLSFLQAPGGGSATAGPASTPLTSTPTPFTTDAAGVIPITYRAPSAVLISGRDAIKARSITRPGVTAFEYYAFNGLTHYAFSPSPIALPGTLGSNQPVAITVTAERSDNSAIVGEPVYLSLQGARLGTATAGTRSFALSTRPRRFTTNASGQVVVTYRASGAPTLPITGNDLIVAQQTASAPPVSGTDVYSYGKPATYAFNPVPIAPPGQIASSLVFVTLTVADSSGNPVAGAKVNLIFTPAPGSGGFAFTWFGNHLLQPTPIVAYTAANGQILLAYVHSFAPPPPTGSDVITAVDDTSDPTIGPVSTSYTY
jgi:hypothetical protein